MVKNIFRVLFSNVWVLIISLANGFIIPQILTVNEYASYSLFLLYVSYTYALHMGFPSGLFIKYGGIKHDSMGREQYKSEIIIIYTVLSFFSVVMFLNSLILHNQLLFYLALSILPVCLVNSYKFLYQAWGLFKKYSLLNSLIPSGVLLVIFLVYKVSGFINTEMMIYTYIGMHLIFALLITIQEFRYVSKVKSDKIICKRNWDIEKIGFMVMIGSYINLLFQSLDKMFVNVFFEKKDFAIYAFAMQLQVIMTLFISAISQPLYYKLASDNDGEDLNIIKEMLIIFGSFSGVAYYVCVIFVKMFIPKYKDSLEVIAIYFAVFPVLAVITSLYVNLYKINKMVKRYIVTLVLVFVMAFFLNLLGVVLFKNPIVIAVSTTVVYYFWFFYSAKHFDAVTISRNDAMYLVGFLGIFFLITNLKNLCIGLLLYLFLIIILAISIYHGNLGKVYRKIICKKL